MKKYLFLVSLIFIVSCSQNKNNEENKTQSSEHESIHQQDLEKYGKPEAQFNFNITEDKTLIDTTIGNFSHPQFSTDGKKIFFTTLNYGEIWVYYFGNATLNKIVGLPRCGVNFQVSDDCENLYFVNKVAEGHKSYSIITYSLKSKNLEVIFTSDERISSLLLNENILFFLENEKPQALNLSDSTLSNILSSTFLFVNNNKLVKCDSTVTDTVSLPNDIIPVSCSYSKDRENIFVLTTNKGILVCDKNGIPINNIQDANFVSKLYQSNLLVFTKEIDSSDKIVSSKIFIGFLNNNKNYELFKDDDSQKFYPDWSPTENKIVYATSFGSIKIVSFNIGKN